MWFGGHLVDELEVVTHANGNSLGGSQQTVVEALAATQTGSFAVESHCRNHYQLYLLGVNGVFAVGSSIWKEPNSSRCSS